MIIFFPSTLILYWHGNPRKWSNSIEPPMTSHRWRHNLRWGPMATKITARCDDTPVIKFSSRIHLKKSGGRSEGSKKKNDPSRALISELFRRKRLFHQFDAIKPTENEKHRPSPSRNTPVSSHRLLINSNSNSLTANPNGIERNPTPETLPWRPLLLRLHINFPCQSLVYHQPHLPSKWGIDLLHFQGFHWNLIKLPKTTNQRGVKNVNAWVL